MQIDENGTHGADLSSNQSYDDSSPYQRLRRYVSDRTKIPQVFGVIRRSVLEQTPLLGSYPKSDTVLMYEMAMRGRFAKVEAPLFLNREHRNRQGQLGLRERTVLVPPRPHAADAPPVESARGGSCGRCSGCPCPPATRSRCLGFVGWWGLNHGAELAGDLWFGRPHRRRPARAQQPAMTENSHGLGRLPTFLIVGAMRCGTTSLNGYLRQHPQVAMGSPKEIHFFDREFDRGSTGTGPTSPPTRARRRRRRSDPQLPVRPCRAGAYRSHPPRRPPGHPPPQPGDRSYSHYWHDRSGTRST